MLPRLLSLAATPQPPAVRAKALLALSGLVRHNAPGLQVGRVGAAGWGKGRGGAEEPWCNHALNSFTKRTQMNPV